MKAKDLMIGDWVMYKDVPIKPSELYNYAKKRDITSKLKAMSELIILDYEYEDCKDLKPIPLTEEILKANGFVNDWKQFELEYIDKGNGWFLVDIEAESIEDGVVTKGCRYVHEVQHALRICKRNELADNFKLE